MATIKLQYPVEHNGTTYEELTMRRPKVRDQLAATKKSGSDAEFEAALFADLAEVEPAVIEGLDMLDYTELQRAYKDFFGLPRK